MNLLLKYLVLGGTLLTASCIGGSVDEPAREYIAEGDRVPAFAVEGAAGIRFSSPEDFSHKTTLLLFFATWCPQCRAELPQVDAVWRMVKDDPHYTVVAVSRGGASGKYEQSQTILEDYWTDNGLSMPWFLDADRSVFDMFASANIPRIYIVDSSGTVMWKAVSPEMKAADYAALLKKY